MVGRSLGHYEILEPLGAGGMGEVYRARDTKLGRDVAIKVLPEDLAKDPERLARMEREATAVAALDHPNIVTVFSVEEAAVEAETDGGGYVHFITMQLVEGKTLSELLPRNGFALEKFFELAIPLADAISAAHERGIIHRDLKPANIMVSGDGRARVLDFGLAKLREDTPVAGGISFGGAAATDSSEAPTGMATVQATSGGSQPLTEEGKILGTVAYMSPEQAEGKPVDHRTDVFSLGIILYEMATGERPFHGDTNVSVISSIVKDTPTSVTEVNRTLPRHLGRIIKHSLEKDVGRRYHAAVDLRNDLQDLKEEIVSGELTAGAPDSAAPPALWRRAATWGSAVVAVIATVVTIWSLTRPEPPMLPRLPLTVDIPHDMELVGKDDSGAWLEPLLAISPDGTQVVYAARREPGPQSLFVQAGGDLQPRKIPGTEDAAAPFFSPDGQWVGFWGSLDRKLYKVSLAGGQPVPIAEAVTFLGATWGTDGNILFVPNMNSGISRVSAAGGEVEILTIPDNEDGEYGHYWPQLLPGGNRVLFTVQVAGNLNRSRIAVYSLETGEQQTVHENGYFARYMPSGHLVYVQSDTLTAVLFDLASLEVTGAPVTMVEGVRADDLWGIADFCVSDDGSLVYVSGGVPKDTILEKVDFQGSSEPLTLEPRPYGNPRVSPDGSRLAVAIAENEFDIWMLDLSRGTGLSRLTTHEAFEQFPVWSPDGEWLAFTTERAGDMDVWRKRVDGTVDAEPMVDTDYPISAVSWSRDGRYLALQPTRPETALDILILDTETEALEEFLVTELNDYWPVFSPDGRWIAYVSTRDGDDEVFVAPFPPTGQGQRISEGGGKLPLWSPSGREIYYQGGGNVMAVALEFDPAFEAGAARVLFGNSSDLTWDIFPDGQHFVMIRPQEGTPLRINLVLNWFEELQQRVLPTER